MSLGGFTNLRFDSCQKSFKNRNWFYNTTAVKIDITDLKLSILQLGINILTHVKIRNNHKVYNLTAVLWTLTEKLSYYN